MDQITVLEHTDDDDDANDPDVGRDVAIAAVVAIKVALPYDKLMALWAAASMLGADRPLFGVLSAKERAPREDGTLTFAFDQH